MLTRVNDRSVSPLRGLGGSHRFGVAAPGNTPQPDRLRADVTALAAIPRNVFNLPALNRAADLIKARWEGMGLMVTEQPVWVAGRPLKNLMVSFGPENAPRWVVGAHYDAVVNTPGADDNASGVAGLLELSRLLKAANRPLTHRIDLVAFTMEEQPFPCSGSAAHAQQLRQQGVPVKGMISLEMIGYFKDTKGSQTYPLKLLRWLYPDTGNFIGVIGYEKGFGLVRQTQRALRQHSTIPSRSIYSPVRALGLDRSDHSSYIAQGFPAVMVTDTANYRTPHYHRPTDTPDTLDYPRMAEVVKGIYGLVTKP
jgi:hypothetical protein